MLLISQPQGAVLISGQMPGVAIPIAVSPAPHTQQTSLPGAGSRRALAILAGLGAGAAILAAYLMRAPDAAPTPQGTPSPPASSQSAALQAAAVQPQHVHLIISGTPGAYVELDGNGLGRIPARAPLELMLPMPDGRDRVALLVVRKNHYIEAAKNLTLSPGRRLQEEFNLQQKPRRSDSRAEKEEPAPPLPPPPKQEPEQPPPGKPLRNPFGVK
jgi:hypothetical protein